ncbi:hypothetical protein GJ496_002853 [Pomphorhynchus laevis]|nr:hypothetical protein GJ496_002853 [Pomphorhynchus laevis]
MYGPPLPPGPPPPVLPPPPPPPPERSVDVSVNNIDSFQKQTEYLATIPSPPPPPSTEMVKMMIEVEEAISPQLASNADSINHNGHTNIVEKATSSSNEIVTDNVNPSDIPLIKFENNVPVNQRSLSIVDMFTKNEIETSLLTLEAMLLKLRSLTDKTFASKETQTTDHLNNAAVDKTDEKNKSKYSFSSNSIYASFPPPQPAVPDQQSRQVVGGSWPVIDPNVPSYVSGAPSSAVPQFHYDEATGSIYDQQLGAYYFPDQRLYFDPRFSAYYVFDESTKAFVFHSQPGRGPTLTDVDGSDYELVRSANDIRRLSALRDEIRDPSVMYPPSLRLILVRPGIGSCSRRGQLFIVPSCVDAALLGTSDTADIRLEFNEEMLMDDKTNILQSIHARIGYFNGEYSVQSCLMDGGCVWVDGRDIGQLAMPLTHDCTLKCADSEFLVHLHNGNTTCIRCEPSFYTVHVSDPPLPLPAQQQPLRSTVLAIKRRYGLLQNQKLPSSKSNDLLAPVKMYQDRAAKRRTLYSNQQSSTTVRKKRCKTAKASSFRMGWRVNQQQRTDGKSSAMKRINSGSNNGSRKESLQLDLPATSTKI